MNLASRVCVPLVLLYMCTDAKTPSRLTMSLTNVFFKRYLALLEYSSNKVTCFDTVCCINFGVTPLPSACTSS